MSYLVYVALFGAAVAFFLWLRDARIFYRTGLPGYRKAAYRGVLFCALAILGVAVTFYSTLELLGLGLILAALYLQGNEKREKIWGSEGTLDRFLGNAPLGKPARKKGG
ncbi:MAG: ABC transporter permease [Methanoregulaceae archaeon]|nr:ABC transporter permease [Methanoregulaceae archaeon]